VLFAIKEWSNHDDKILSFLCKGIINRELLKIIYFGEAVPLSLLEEKRAATCKKMKLTEEEAGWLTFTGEVVSSTYDFDDENIHILFKNGQVKDISAVDHALIHQNLRGKIKKYYICYLR
jgi:hypothetical protein